MSTSSPRATRAGRLADYLVEMFPPWTYVPFGLALFATVHGSLQALAGREPLLITWRFLVGALTVTLFLLLFRVYDELKDVETDLRLGRAGDPRYKDRAIVTGRVTEPDIRFLRWLVTAALVAVNLPLGYPLPALAFAVVFLLTWLSFRWFFWPAVSKNLLLAFVTHNPLVLTIAAYVAAIYVHDFGTAGLGHEVMWAFGAVWLPMAAWETSRKVRAKEDETTYQTYSMMLGIGLASLLPALFVVGATACLLALTDAIGISWIYRGILLGVATLCCAVCLRFRLAPSKRTARLQPYFETFNVVASIGFVVALVIELGVRFAVS